MLPTLPYEFRTRHKAGIGEYILPILPYKVALWCVRHCDTNLISTQTPLTSLTLKGYSLTYYPHMDSKVHILYPSQGYP